MAGLSHNLPKILDTLMMFCIHCIIHYTIKSNSFIIPIRQTHSVTSNSFIISSHQTHTLCLHAKLIHYTITPNSFIIPSRQTDSLHYHAKLIHYTITPNSFIIPLRSFIILSHQTQSLYHHTKLIHYTMTPNSFIIPWHQTHSLYYRTKLIILSRQIYSPSCFLWSYKKFKFEHILESIGTHFFLYLAVVPVMKKLLKTMKTKCREIQQIHGVVKLSHSKLKLFNWITINNKSFSS